MATLAVFDLDGTLTRFDTFRTFVPWYLARAPWRLPRFWRLPLAAMLYEAGLRDNAWLKARALAAALGRRREDRVAALLDRFLDRVFASGMRPGALVALRAHQQAGHRIVLLSANFDFFVRRFAARLGIAETISTLAERDAKGRFTGRLASPNCYGAEKCRRLEAFLDGARADFHIIVYADHPSDVPLMRWADEAVLVNPSARALRAARGLIVQTVTW